MSYEEKASKIEKHPVGWIFAVLLGGIIALGGVIGYLWKNDKAEEREQRQEMTRQLKEATELIKQMSAHEQENNRRRDSLERENKRITEELQNSLKKKSRK